ncbi:MAG: 50S ribosomal protein L9 [Lachnospiraceae bacterium]|nr:50S ribosomal protein L9 [Lachnospiraceae bacterium]
MKIVLLENVKKLGKKDEIIEVSDGYARNVLIPKKLGLPATAENLNNVRLKNKNEEKKEENLRNIAEKDKEVIEKTKFAVSIKAGANGKTFGSITSKEIAEAIKNESNIDVDKKDILLDESIKNVGTYDVKVKLHKDIQATIKVEVKEA